MKITTRQLWFATAIIIGLIALSTWYWLAINCDGPARRLAMKQTGGVGCFEFWLNRYQSAWSALMGAGAALFAARIAWLAVQKQVAEQQRANKATFLGIEMQRRRDLDRELAEISAAADIHSIIAEERRIRFDGHQYPFIAIAANMELAGHFPFEKIGPSAHPLVNKLDKNMARAWKIYSLRDKNQQDKEVDEKLGRQFNPLQQDMQWMHRDVATTQSAILDANTTIARLRREIASENTPGNQAATS